MQNKRNVWANRLLLAGIVCTVAGCGLFNKLKETVSALEDAKVADNYEPSEQYYIGRGVSAVIVDKYPPVEAKDQGSERQITYVNEMAGYIEAASKGVTRSARKLGDHTKRSYDEQEHVYNLVLFKGMQVGLLQTDDVTAFATPGGFLWVSMGTVKMCNNEDELAAVIAHELAHIILDHGMANYRTAYKGQIFTSTLSETWFSGDGLGANFGRLVTTFAEDAFKGYNPEQEFEADNWGTRALAASGYAPDAMVKMLQSVEAYEKAHEIDPEDYLAHHPPIGERIKAVQDLIKTEKLTGNSKTMTPEAITARNKRFEEAFK
ncbi:MAG: M48 family metalloprotease [Planctomycetes bacterium]|nr:M48 family metalloprotease [Planctomycetota bacterium]MCB9935689.1 M48 family metalloprotease [Planctomycetota bacterium]